MSRTTFRGSYPALLDRKGSFSNDDGHAEDDSLLKNSTFSLPSDVASV